MADHELGQRLRRLRQTYRGVGVKQVSVAEAIGVSQAVLSSWERGVHEPSSRYINRLAKFFEVDPSALYGSDEMARTGPTIFRESSAAAHVPIPRTVAAPTTSVKIYGAISAGDGNTSSITQAEIEVPAEFARDDYGALIVEGDSMLPFLHPSDIAIFRDWRQQKVGSACACRLSQSGDWVIKIMVYESGRYILRSLNPAYHDITEPFEMTGFLVGIVRDDGPQRMILLNPLGIRP